LRNAIDFFVDFLGGRVATATAPKQQAQGSQGRGREFVVAAAFAMCSMLIKYVFEK
jgi:hypothetical protein